MPLPEGSSSNKVEAGGCPRHSSAETGHSLGQGWPREIPASWGYNVLGAKLGAQNGEKACSPPCAPEELSAQVWLQQEGTQNSPTNSTQGSVLVSPFIKVTNIPVL